MGREGEAVPRPYRSPHLSGFRPRGRRRERVRPAYPRLATRYFSVFRARRSEGEGVQHERAGEYRTESQSDKPRYPTLTHSHP